MATMTLTAVKSAVMARNKSGTNWYGWAGKDNHLQVGGTSSYRWRAVIRFPIWELPNNITEITAAELRLTGAREGNHSWSTGGTMKLKIGRMTADWAELSNNPGDGIATSGLTYDWSNRANTFASSKISGPRSQPTDGAQMDDIDLLTITNEWVFDGKANYGIILINNTSEYDTSDAFLFRSDEYASGKPKLLVTYSTNSAPTSVDGTLPADGTTQNTLTPNFYGVLNDADNDDITAWQVHVSDDTETDAATGNMWNSGKVDVTGGGGVTIATSGNTITIPYGAETDAYDPEDNRSTIYVKPLEPGETYYWKMQLYDEGDASVWSSVKSFITNSPPNAPTVTVTPTPLSAVPDNTPNFSVVHTDPDPSDTLMDGYQLLVDSESSEGAGDWLNVWDTGAVDLSGAPVASVQVTSTTLNWGTSYRVYARTQDSNGAWGSYSSPVTFVTQKTSIPIVLNPTGSQTTGGTPTMSGQRGSADDTIEAYSLEVYNDALTTAFLSETEYTDGTDGNTFSKLYGGTSLIAGDAYQWRAKVDGSIGGYSDWSDWQRFVVESDTSVPDITSPVGDGGYTLTPTIAFNRAANFDYYDYEIYPETSTEANLGTAHYTSTNNSQTAATSASFTYAGTALEWATGYKIRVRVSPNAGVDWSSWTGLVWFKTASIAGPPVLDTVAGSSDNPAWITDSTPEFAIDRYSGDTYLIDKMQYRIWNANGSAVIYEESMTDVADAASASLTYSGALLVPGTSYKWDARYQNTQGPISPWSTKHDFRLNGGPTAPASHFPPPSYVYLDTDTKTFRAEFDDTEEDTFGDYPTDWEIYIHNEDTDSQHGTTQSITSGLTNGLNETTWSGTAFVVGTNYSWQTRFQDSKSEWGAWSASQGFRVSTPPNGTISTPSNGSTVSTVTPVVSWNITGDQERYTIVIDETTDTGDFVAPVTTLNYYNTATTSDNVTLPTGYFKNGKHYDVTLTIVNADNLSDPSPSTVNVEVNLDAPDPVESIDSLADLESSTQTIYWANGVDGGITWALSPGHSFVAWRIWRRLKSFTDWTHIEDIPSQSQYSWVDYYAGHNMNYQYRVAAVTTKTGVGLELEGGDDASGGNIIEAQVASPDWHLIGADRAPQHNSLLVVDSEDHNRPIQQEVFETLGSDRKVIMRGFVLGHEGTVNTLWFNEDVVAPEDEQLLMTDTYRGKRIADYLTRTPGPHILKSPFGDVWDVQFATPKYEWLPTGHLSLKLEWIETGNTSDGSEF